MTHWTQDAGHIRTKLAELAKDGVIRDETSQTFHRLAARVSRMTGICREEVVRQAFNDGQLIE